jgi:DTW domain-containing protein YfiP
MTRSPLLPPLPAPPSARAVCPACRRPPALCYCAHLPQLAPRTKVVILQHPRERGNAIGTAHMARLCLPGAALHVGYQWDDSRELAAHLGNPEAPAALLYPGPGARDVVTDPPDHPVTLIVVDGTWSTAKTTVRDSAVLSALPRFAFTPARPSEYRIRKEPSETCHSTIEALAAVLGALEGEPARYAAMLAPFRAMVDLHVAARAQHTDATPRRKQRVARPPTAPDLELLLARWDDVVCVAGEANAWRYVDGRDRHRDELVHWVATRPADGASIDVLARPRGELAPSTSFHLQVTDDAILSAPPLDELRRRVTAFARPRDVWCGWGYYPLTLARLAALGDPDHYVDLRALAQRLGRGAKVGLLDGYAATQLSTTPAPIGRGRGGSRAALLAALVTAWRVQRIPHV